MEVGFGIQGSGQLVGGLPDPELFRTIAVRAEEVGYDSIWAGDHISFHNALLDVTVALATFAAATDRILLGAGVVLLPVRHPSLVAKAFASLDYLSGGRVVLGVGVGGEGAKDFEAVGVPIRERGARTDEAMLALRHLFGDSPASFSGRFFSFDGVSIDPPPTRPGGPPLWVGGRSDAALRRAGRLGDGWLPIWVSPERFSRGWEEIRRYAEEAGRDPAALVPAVVLPARVGARARSEVRDYLGRRYGTAFEDHQIERYCLAGTPSECAERVQAYVEAGVRHVVFNPAVPPEGLLDECERLYEEVVVAVTA